MSDELVAWVMNLSENDLTEDIILVLDAIQITSRQYEFAYNTNYDILNNHINKLKNNGYR